MKKSQNSPRVSKIKRHVGITLLLIIAAVLLIRDEFIDSQNFIGVLAIIWALLLMRVAKGEEGAMKPLKETEFYKKIKEEQ